jgi:hypothetical protein
MTLLLLLLLAIQPRVIIDPPSILLAPGDTVGVSAIFLTEKGKEIKPKDIEWEVVPRKLGRVEKGIFKAMEPGIGVLKAKIEYERKIWVGNAYVEINPKRRLRIHLKPKWARLEPGEEIKFEIEPSVEVTEWKVIPQWLGEIKEGLFKAGERRGAGQVVAVVKTEEGRGLGTAQVVVGSPEEFELKVKINPPFVVLSKNEEMRFHYTVEGGKPEKLKLTWWLEPSFIGEIDEEGNLRVNAERGRGAVWLLAETEGKVGLGRAIVVVAPPGERPELNIIPPYLVLLPGESSTIEIQIKNIPIEKIKKRKPRILWRVRPPRLGNIRGRGPRAIFNAGEEPGIGAIVLNIGRGRGRDVLRTAIPVIVGNNKLSISPIEVTLSPGDTVRFHLKGPPELTSEVEWIVRPANGGKIGEDGTFTPSGASTKVYVIALLPKKLGGGGAIALVRVKRSRKP